MTCMTNISNSTLGLGLNQHLTFAKSRDRPGSQENPNFEFQKRPTQNSQTQTCANGCPPASGRASIGAGQVPAPGLLGGSVAMPVGALWIFLLLALASMSASYHHDPDPARRRPRRRPHTRHDTQSTIKSRREARFTARCKMAMGGRKCSQACKQSLGQELDALRVGSGSLEQGGLPLLLELQDGPSEQPGIHLVERCA